MHQRRAPRLPHILILVHGKMMAAWDVAGNFPLLPATFASNCSPLLLAQTPPSFRIVPFIAIPTHSDGSHLAAFSSVSRGQIRTQPYRRTAVICPCERDAVGYRSTDVPLPAERDVLSCN
jgi:hypothetical protein